MIKYSKVKSHITDILTRLTGKQSGGYCEPFTGSASVFNTLAKEKLIDRAVLTDINPHTVMF